MTSPARCSCPYQYDERTGGSVRAGLDQFCPVHGGKQQQVPHCATCTCGVGSKIVQDPVKCNHSGGFVRFNEAGQRTCSICGEQVFAVEQG